MNKKALLKLAEILDDFRATKVKINHGVKKFNLTEWVDVKECGTSACACGTAGLHPWFRKRGFEVPVYETKYGNRIEYSFDSPQYTDPKTGFEHSNWDAVSMFFGINVGAAEYLFSSASYTPHQNKRPSYVAKRIRKFVETDGEGFCPLFSTPENGW